MDFKINFKHMKASEGSHIPVLIKVMQNSTGDVLELGTGLNSTPVLHWLCNEAGRKIDSYESSEMFYHAAENYRNEWHGVHFITDWDTIEAKHWGVIFIDHAPGKRRVEDMIRLANSADYVIIHDSEPKSDWHYNYSKGFHAYKFKYDYTKAYPSTSVLSNFFDPNELWK